MTFFETITGGTAIEVYGGLTACDAYLLAAIGDGADAYRALTAGGDDRKRLLITATRTIDSYDWLGVATLEGGTTLQFPRSGLTKTDGTAMSSAEQLALVSRAVFEFVAILADDPAAASAVDTGSNIQRVDAGGGVGVSFFAASSQQGGNATRLPTVVHRLIGRLLGGGAAASAADGGYGQSGACVSSFSDYSDYDRNEPY